MNETTHSKTSHVLDLLSLVVVAAIVVAGLWIAERYESLMRRTRILPPWLM